MDSRNAMLTYLDAFIYGLLAKPIVRVQGHKELEDTLVG
jgi:hypothetical protein